MCRISLEVHNCIWWNWWFQPISSFCELCSNNKSATLLSCFIKGLQTYGIPSWVWSDTGKESVLITNFMIANRGPERGSLICCKSTHNERIERLWRDAYNGVTGIYHELPTLWRMKKFLTPSLSLIWQHFIKCFCLLLTTSLMSGDRDRPNTVCEK